MIPILGLPSRIHATVNRIPGMIRGMIDNAKNRALKGVLVRSFIHASAVPTTKANSDAPKANLSEFQNSRRVSLEFAFGASLFAFVVGTDRKSTRLNSSHTVISYAVFCLKKKTHQGDE